MATVTTTTVTTRTIVLNESEEENGTLTITLGDQDTVEVVLEPFGAEGPTAVTFTAEGWSKFEQAIRTNS